MNTNHWPAAEARWIGMAGCEQATNLFLEFVRPFSTAADSHLSIAITAASRYTLYLNGRELARGPAASQPTLRYFHRYRVPAAQLTAGDNLLAVRLFHDGAPTTTIQGFEYGPPGLLLAAESKDVSFVSDEQWRVRRSPLFSGNVQASQWGGYKEFYHGDREDDWLFPAHDHAAWASALALAPADDPAYAARLVALTLPELAEARLAPAQIVDLHRNLGAIIGAGSALPTAYAGQELTVAATEPGAMPAIIFDFGQEVVGYPEVALTGGFCIYELWYGESLDLWRLDVVRSPADGMWRAFHRRAFRYLKIQFIALPQPITLTDVSILDTRYAYDRSGHITTADGQLDAIVAISQETLRANTSFHFEDCPWREQALWVFDMRVMALQNYYYYGDAPLVRKNIAQIFALQLEDGAIPSTGPLQNNCHNLDFCLHLVATLREYHGYSADATLLAEVAPALDRLDRYIAQHVDGDGLLTTDNLTRGGAFLDWSRDIARTPRTLILNALYAEYLRDMAFLDELRGRDSADRLARRAALVQRTGALFLDPPAGRYADALDANGGRVGASRQANMAALFAGIAPPMAGDRLLAACAALPPPYAPAFHFIVFEALAAAGRHDRILAEIRDYWGAMVARGAVTWWEVFDPRTPAWVYPHPFLGNTPTYEMDWIPTSACHGWSGTAGLAVLRHLAGIDLLQLWQNRVVITPPAQPQLRQLRYRVPLRGGHLSLAMQADGTDTVIDILETPPGITVELGGQGGMLR